MRRTKIIATLGPSTDSREVLDAIVDAGVDAVRLNASHSGPGELKVRLEAVRESAARAGRHLSVILDLPGPKVRVGEMAPGAMLVSGQEFTLTTAECVGDSSRAGVSYRGFATDVERGHRILIDDGHIELKVTESTGDEVHTQVVVGGELGSHKGVNVPGALLRVEPITRLDATLVAWAAANDIDWIAQSFVRTASDIDALRGIMTTRSIPIIAKIEKYEAVAEVDRLIDAADAVMVARGDLAVETSPERVPVLQRRIVATARAAGKPVIIATEMLESMRERQRPTRAEASDVAGAIFSHADAAMLAAETAVGHYPVDTVETMARIAASAEEAADAVAAVHGTSDSNDIAAAVSAAARDLADDLRLAAIVTLTQSGATAMSVARLRPSAPILAVTPSMAVAQRLALVWGVRPIVVEAAADGGVEPDAAVLAAVHAGALEPGQRVVLTAGLGRQRPGTTDFLHVRVV